jgi:hypothetical protein
MTPAVRGWRGFLLGAAWLVVMAAMVATAPRPADRPPGATPGDDPLILGDSGSVTLPFQLIDNRIFLDVRVNDRGPYRFILDSGSGNLLEMRTARELGLCLFNRTEIGGAGAARGARLAGPVRQLGVGPSRCPAAGDGSHWSHHAGHRLRSRGRPARLRALPALRGAHRHAAGRITFARPRLARSGTRLPFTLRGRVPRIRAVVDSIAGDFIVDTGDRSALTLFRPFQDAHRLLDRYPARIEALTGWGIGGPIPATVVRTRQVKLGGLVARGVIARLPGADSGEFNSSDVAGSVGTGLLKRFQVTFDYAGQALWLTPGPTLGEPDPCDRAGLWLSRAGDDLETRGVVAGGPAASAGVRVGDRISAVDGQEAAGSPAGSARPTGHRSPGSHAPPPPAPHTLTLTLRDLLPPR